jgi:hypothetical protein
LADPRGGEEDDDLSVDDAPAPLPARRDAARANTTGSASDPPFVDASAATRPTDAAARDGAAPPDGTDVDAGSVAQDARAADAGPVPAGKALGGPSRCASGAFAICEGFEDTEPGAFPSGWRKLGGRSVKVVAGQAARGARALEIGQASAGMGQIAKTKAQLGRLAEVHWGRVFYKVKTPAPKPSSGVIHSDLVEAVGPNPLQAGVASRVRWGMVENTAGNFMWIYNVQRAPGPEFARGTGWSYQYKDEWVCVEWHFDNPNQRARLYLDGVEIRRLTLDNGPGNYKNSEIPLAFDTVAIGWVNYQRASPGFLVWIDEVAIDAARIGCER